LARRRAAYRANAEQERAAARARYHEVPRAIRQKRAHRRYRKDRVGQLAWMKEYYRLHADEIRERRRQRRAARKAG